MAHSVADKMAARDQLVEGSQLKNEEARRGIMRRAYVKLVEIVKQKDPPHKIALGMALGIFIGLLPIMGIQMAVVTAFALPFRGNLKAAIAGVWISNPITFIPMYWGYYQFGLLFTPSRQIDREQFSGIVSAAFEWSWTEISLSVNRIMDMGADILIPMWIGSTILAVVFGVLTYFVTYRLVVKYRLRRRAAKA